MEIYAIHLGNYELRHIQRTLRIDSQTGMLDCIHVFARDFSWELGDNGFRNSNVNLILKKLEILEDKA